MSNQAITLDAIAVMRDTNEIVAQGVNLTDLFKRVDASGVWDKAPGSHAPYFITSLASREFFNAWYPEGFWSKPHQQ